MASGWQVNGTVVRNNGRNTGATIWATDAAAAQPIDASGHDTHDEGLADSIEDCLHIGGYNSMTADLDMNTNDILSAVNIQASGDIVFSERADHASTPAAGKGYLWVKSDAPSSLIFTDDAGTDYNLTNITSVGTLTSLTVDNLTIDGNTITADSGALNLTPAAGSAIVLDGTINVDAGVVTGATSITSTTFVGALTGNASTATTAGTVTTAAQPNITSLGTLTTLTVDNITINGAAITSGTGAISFGNENLTTTGTLNCGAFTSTGIDDNATSEQLQIGDTRIDISQPLFIAESAAAETDVSGYGQIWVKNDTPNKLYFTDDAGTDFPIIEYGTWTPTLQDDTLSDAESQAYTINEGRYQRVGNRVFFEGRLDISSLGSLTTTQTAIIAGLPFTSINANHRGVVNIGFLSGGSVTAGQSINGLVVSNTDYIRLYIWDAATGTSVCPISALSATGDIYFAGSYSIA